jgi:two-component system, NarL family, sensor histidine kinase DegS
MEGAGQRLSPQVALTCLRIVQEAFTNVIKHAQANEMSLAVSVKGNNAIDIQLTDDGVGFDQSNISSGGNGLDNMRTRAEELSGTLNICSGEKKGTIVHLEVPLSETDIPRLGD